MANCTQENIKHNLYPRKYKASKTCFYFLYIFLVALGASCLGCTDGKLYPRKYKASKTCLSNKHVFLLALYFLSCFGCKLPWVQVALGALMANCTQENIKQVKHA